MRLHLKLSLICIALCFSLGIFADAKETRSDSAKPNIVVILADDLGYGDVQPNNSKSKIETPNFNRLAREGMNFTDAHSPSAVCTPTRYALITGRYPWRSRMKRGVLGGYSLPLIEKDRQTIASVMKKAGYSTACVGKWHLGLGWQWKSPLPRDINNMGIPSNKPGNVDFTKPLTHGPTYLGFDRSFIIPASLDMSPYVYVKDTKVTAVPDKILPGKRFPAFYRRGELAPDFKMEDVLDRLTKEACGFIGEQAKAKKPFFLYFPLSAPHKPVLPHPRFEGKTKFGPYGDFIKQVDWTVGEVMKALESNGVSDNTILIVTSDNGSFMYRYPNQPKDHAVNETVQGFHPDTHTSNGPLRGTKADIWEAGHRVPFMVRWPGKVKAGTKSGKTICHTDILATVAEVVGADFDRKSSEDSFSFLDAMEQRSEMNRAPVIHQSGSGFLAIRSGKWKLVLADGSGGRERPRGKAFQKPYHLYDLESDLGETKNVVADHPELVAQLIASFEKISHKDHVSPANNKKKANKNKNKK